MIVNNTFPYPAAQKSVLNIRHSVQDLVRGLDLPDLPTGTFDESRLETLVDQFRFRLYLLRIGIQSEETLSDEEIRSFTRYLINQQNLRIPGHYAYGCWSLIRYRGLNRSLAYDYVYRPSQIAVAWLVLIRTRYPAYERGVEGFQRALDAGLHFIAKNKLKGGGYHQSKGLVNSIDTLATGGVLTYVTAISEDYDDLRQTLIKAKETLSEPYKAGSWDNASPLECSRALRLLNGADVDDAFVCPWVWGNIKYVQHAVFVQRLLKEVPSKVAARLKNDIVESIEKSLDQIKLAYEIESPKYVVLKSRRRFRSKPIIIDRYFDLIPIAMEAMSSFDVMPFVGILTVDEILKGYDDVLWYEVSRSLNRIINDHEPIQSLNFNVNIRSITNHCPYGFMIDLVAVG